VSKKCKFARDFLLFSAVPLAALGASERSFAADARPTIAKDWVQVNALTLDSYKKDFDKWSWVPKIDFRVFGPIPSGAQLYLDFNIPGAGSVKFDCPTQELVKGRYLDLRCGGRDVPEEKSTQYTGKVSFAIKMRNELNNTDVALFNGKMTVDKLKSNEHGPQAANKFVFYVDDDWNLPIGYLYLTQDDIRNWDLPRFHASFWVRGDDGSFEPHIFFNGKEVGKIAMQGMQVGQASCDSEVEKQTNQSVDDSIPQKAKWTRMHCDFPNVVAWNKVKDGTGLDSMFVFAKNPGNYELKILWQNHLARSIKFSVTADGRFDNGVATSNNLGDDRVIVPVQILGDQDGKWNKSAWKSDAFYGNPLNGFKAVQ
jgi:hypothetical protein